MVTLAITGDVMLGRLVDRYVFSDPGRDPAEVWGDTPYLLAAADLRLMNLECVIGSQCVEWRRAPKAFNFGACPRAIEALTDVGTDCVSLANNHVLDFGAANLLEMLDLLDAHGIARAGAGRELVEALRPAFLTTGGTTVAVLGVTDNEPEWEAGEPRPGVNHVEYGDQGLSEPYLGRLGHAIGEARRRADLVIVSAHVGPNWGAPSTAMRALARQLIDLGADLYWGHSCHTTQGIELYRGRPILYATGDFLDDYAVDPAERNDLSFLFRVGVEHGAIRELRLHPVRIGHLQVNRAKAADAGWVMRWMRDRCRPFGTPLREEDGALVVPVSPAPAVVSAASAA